MPSQQTEPLISPTPQHLAGVANLLTYIRIALVPVMVGLFYLPGGRLWASVAFAAACLTDALDGYAARRLDLHSSFGRMLDPIADKILAAAAILILVSDATIAGWSLAPALIILAREILVSGLREHLIEFRVPLPTSRLAKTKTGLQMISLGLLLAAPAFGLGLETGFITDGALALLWIAALLTLYTGAQYFRAGLSYFQQPHP